MLLLRGKNSAKVFEGLRGTSGKIELPIIGSDITLVVNNVYKYLGSIVSMSGDIIADARYKASQAMAAYSPLAIKVFASQAMSAALKIAFATSLVVSRLCFNVHVVVPTSR